MSRYNEDEWNRLKEAERERQKRKYQNKYLDDTYKQLEKERKELKESNNLYLRNNYKKPDKFNDIKEIKVKNDNGYGKYIIISLCIIVVMGSGFLFSGFYENFFYEKTKQDIIKATNGISDLTNSLNKKNLFNKPIKKWKRTIWTETKGRVCNKGKCTYHIKELWRDCYIATGKCNKIKSRSLERDYNSMNRSRTTYF